MQSPTVATAAMLVLAFVGNGVTADDDTATVLNGFISEYCASCHEGASAEGGLNLVSVDAADVGSDFATWENVLRKLRVRQMPPLEVKRPTEVEYAAITSVLEQELDRRAALQPRPGRTDTFRRLTRTEYRNAVRDLLGLTVDVSTLLPKDEVSHGFDNVTVGNLSPTLLNRYLTAAQRISRLAVGATVSSRGDTFRVRPDLTQEEHVTGLPIGTRGGLLIPYHFPADGQYTVTVRLMRDRNEHIEGLRREHQLEVLLNRERKELFTIAAPKSDHDRQTADQHLTTTFTAAAGEGNIGVTFLKMPSSLIETKRQPFQAHFNFHRHPRQSPAIYEVSVVGPHDTQQPACDANFANTSVSTRQATAARRRIFVRYPETAADEDDCAREIMATLVRRAFRRSITDADLAGPLEFYRRAAAQDGFDAGIEAAISSILVNPQFLFRVEREPEGLAPSTAYAISDTELATRLSFFLWSSIPDDRLLQLAEENRLSDPVTLRQEVSRMLKDARSQSLISNFASQWLYLRNLESLTPDLRLFPDFDHNLRLAFRRETESLFESVVREDRSVLDLLSADDTFMNERLAKHYGIPHVYGSRVRRVSVSQDGQRGGLLRHGSILTVTSYATRTSPVVRGNWVLENLLGAPAPPPPDDVPALEENDVDAGLSVRKRLEAHRENPACASCHNLMDPVGFALENFDAIGRWRDVEAGTPVDTSGGLPDGSQFDGVAGLERALLNRPELFVGTLVEKLLTYALGRGIEPSDGPAVRRVVRASADHDYRFSAIVEGIVESPAFQMRMTK